MNITDVSNPVKGKDIIHELAMLYALKAGDSAEYSFYAWLDASGIEPSREAWQYVIDNFNEYEI